MGPPNKKKYVPHGFTIGQFVFVVFVLLIIVVVIIAFFGRGMPLINQKSSIYKSWTTESGRVPVKVVVTNPHRARLYSKSKENSKTEKYLEFFKYFFVFGQKNDFYRVGDDPTIKKSIIGWIKKSDTLLWNTREALQVKLKKRGKPILIWERKEDIGVTESDYEQRTDKRKFRPYPVHETDENHYKITFTWQMRDKSQWGATTGWTSKLKTPQDADIVCFILRDELEKRITALIEIIQNIKNKPHSEHPIIRLFQEDLSITFGPGLSIDEESIDYIKRVAEVPVIPAIFDKQPAEIRSEIQRHQATLNKLKAFYENSANWNKKGRGMDSFSFDAGKLDFLSYRLNAVSKIYTPKATGRRIQPVNALSDIDLSIRHGEFLAILGPSGSGKSTLLHLLGGLDIPTRGDIYLSFNSSKNTVPDQNLILNRLNEDRRSQLRQKIISFIFQAFFLVPTLTTQENVEIPLLFAGIPLARRRKMTMRILESIDLIDRHDHFPNELSGGEQQRVAIARALITDPSILLADEPTGNLDSASEEKILTKLKELCETKGLTIVLVTHDIDVAKKVATRIIYLKDGCINEETKF